MSEYRVKLQPVAKIAIAVVAVGVGFVAVTWVAMAGCLVYLLTR